MSTVSSRSGARSAWPVLVTVTAAAVFVVVAAVGVTRRDRETLAFATLVPVALGLAHVGRGRAGRALLAFLLLDVGVWMLPAAVSNLAHREPLSQVVVPVVLVSLSATGLVASAGAAVSRRRGSSPGPAPAVTVALALALTGLVLGVAAVRGRQGGTVARPGDVVVSTRGMAFSPESLRVAAGPVGVA